MSKKLEGLRTDDFDSTKELFYFKIVFKHFGFFIKIHYQNEKLEILAACIDLVDKP